MPTLPTAVVVHPLVLLSVVDHYNRVAKDSRRRVVGVLLGSTYQVRLLAVAVCGRHVLGAVMWWPAVSVCWNVSASPACGMGVDFSALCVRARQLCCASVAALRAVAAWCAGCEHNTSCRLLVRSQGKVDITNSYAVPFEERGDTWYLDHAYLTSMFQMFKKVAGSWLRCVLVGMYAFAPLIACAP